MECKSNLEWLLMLVILSLDEDPPMVVLVVDIGLERNAVRRVCGKRRRAKMVLSL